MTLDVYDIIEAQYSLLHDMAPRMGFDVARASWRKLNGYCWQGQLMFRFSRAVDMDGEATTQLRLY
jgi:hypothetical protein